MTKFLPFKSASIGVGITILSICGLLTTQAQELEVQESVELPNFVLVEDIPEPVFFTDVDNTHEKYTASKILQKLGVISGYSDGTAKLEQDINRAEFVKILLETKKQLDDTLVIEYDPAHTFPDISASAWYAKYVSTAKRLGIIQGYPDGTFKPEQNINYPEAYKIILNTLEIDVEATPYLPPALAEHQDQWFSPFIGTVMGRQMSPELIEIEGIEGLSQNISRGASFDALYRGYSIVAGPEEFKTQAFTPPDFFFGSQDGIIQTPFEAPYYLPIAYRGSLQGGIQGKLYKMSIDTFLKTQQQKQEDDDRNCCMIHHDLRYHIPNALLEEMTLVSAFQTEVKKIPGQEATQRYEKSYIALPISEPGIYALRVENELIPQEDVILIPSNTSMEKRTGDHENLIWVVDNISLSPVADAVIKGYSLSGDFPREVLSSTTDQDGLAMQENVESDILIASTNKELTVLKSSSFGPPIPFPEPIMMDVAIEEAPVIETPIQDMYKVYAYTDRPIYRPDQAVYFKGIVRQDNQGIYSMPNISEVEVTVSNFHNAGENIIYEGTLPLSEYGTYNGNLMLDPEMGTGMYYIKTIIGETTLSSGTFEVESYKKQEYELSMTPDKDAVVQGDRVKINVNAMYFFGQPLADQVVDYTITKSQYYPIVPFEEFGEFGDEIGIMPKMYPPSYYGGEVFDSGSFKLDNSGDAILIFETDTEQDFVNREYTVEISVTDESNIPVKKRISILAYASNIDLSIEGPQQGEINRNFEAIITTLDHDEDVLAGTPLEIMLERNGYEGRDCGQYFDIWQKTYLPQRCWDYTTELILETEEVTDSRGEYEFEYVPQRGGNYKLSVIAMDTKERKVKKEFHFTVSGPELHSSYNYVSVTTSKKEYNIGEVVVASATTSVDKGIALVTFAKGDIFTKQVVPFENYSIQTAIPVTNSEVPGFSVYVDVFKDHTFSHGSTTAKVYPANKKLIVNVLPGKEKALPDEEVSWIIAVKDANGDPVRGEVSLALVDKAIYEIRKHKLNAAFDDFYQPRYSYIAVDTSKKQQLINLPSGFDTRGGFEVFAEDAMDMEMAEPAAMPMGPAEVMEKSTGAAPPSGAQIVRELFEDTGAWVAEIETNKDGIGRADLKLPHNLTTWVGVSLAVTKDTEIGFGDSEILVQKDLVVRPFTPRFVTVGDDLNIRANVHNYLASGANFQVLGRQICSSEQTNSACQEVNLADHMFKDISGNDYKAFSWSYKVPNYFKEGDIMELKFMAEQPDQDEIRDELIVRIPVHAYGVKKTHSESGEGSTSYTIMPESGDISNIQKVAVHLSPTLTENLIKSLEYLTGYPYGCVEQTMSRFLPNIVVWNARDTLQFNKPNLFDELPDQVRTGLQRLYRFQHHDGGWGWWQDDESTDKNTAYVMFGLKLAKDAGFEIDENIFAQGIKYMETSLSTTDFVKYHPYILSILSSIEAKPEYKEFGRLFMEKVNYKTLPSIDLARLIEWESHYGEQKYAPALIAEIEKRLKGAGNTLYLEEEVIDYERMGSSQLTTAVVAATFAKLGLKPDITEKMIRWLDQSRNGYAYHETHATSHAVIALVEFLKRNPESSSSNVYNVKLNGAEIESGSLNAMKTIEIATTALNEFGDNQIEITKESGGKLYYTILVTEFVPGSNDEEFFGSSPIGSDGVAEFNLTADNGSSLAGFNNGFKVNTRFLDADGQEAFFFDTGDIVKIHVDVEALQESHYVMGRIFLPAGLEAINPRLEGFGGFYGGYFTNQDIYDDHIAVFATHMSQGSNSYSFDARAVTPGEFRYNPTQFEMMYAPEVNGASAGGTVEVK